VPYPTIVSPRFERDIECAALPAGARYFTDANTAQSWSVDGCDECGEFAVVVAEVTLSRGAATDADWKTLWVTGCPEHAARLVRDLVDRPGDYPDGHGVEVEVWAPWLRLSDVPLDRLASHGVGTGGWL
jgi:hypothetical protein